MHEFQYVASEISDLNLPPLLPLVLGLRGPVLFLLLQGDVLSLTSIHNLRSKHIPPTCLDALQLPFFRA